MTLVPRDPRDGLDRLLRDIPREEPPEIPLDAVLERLGAARRRSFAFGALAVAAAALTLILLPRGEPAPPVHLPVHVVDRAGKDATQEGRGAILVEGPEELRLP